MDTSKVTLNLREGFGGSRIPDGQVSVDLWSDGVVLGTAWSMKHLDGTLFTFRGELSRSRRTSRVAWRLVSVAEGYLGTFNTRRDALAFVRNVVTMDAFRELNRIEAAR